MADALQLVKIPVRPEKLALLARRRGLPVREIDDGYLSHCVLRELFGEHAPAPFVLRSQGRMLDVWGYTCCEGDKLADHARAFGDPAVLDVFDGLQGMAAKTMPVFQRGRRLGFLLRACPVARLAGPVSGHRAGAEVDVFLARCFSAGREVIVSREDVYRDWLASRLSDVAISGVTAVRVRVAGISRERLVRRTHGAARAASRLERPDVRFDGEFTVDDGDRFLRYLAHGVGRHRAFGFGALIVVPPGTTYSA
jgi:CRISPR system Cascade subunit CasE